jgi:hypothetical protein
LAEIYRGRKEETMNAIKAYRKVYETLDEYWISVEDEEYDELANMLSDMMPFADEDKGERFSSKEQRNT